MNVDFDIPVTNNSLEDTIELAVKILPSYVSAILKVAPNAKFSLDVEYYTTQNYKIDTDKLKECFIHEGYERSNLLEVDLRKFEYLYNRNVTTNIAFLEKDDSLSYIIQVNNIIVDQSSIASELKNTIFLYKLQNIKIHYYIINMFDKSFVKDNSKFYSQIKLKI